MRTANGSMHRTLGRLEATPLAGTEGALSPFFSPDGAWIGFFADRRLKRIPAGGGAAVDIAAVSGYPAGASWGIDNRIVFASGARSPLRIVDAGGGTPEPLTTPAAGHGHRFPQILPDGRTLLFNEGRWIHALDLASGRRTDRLVARHRASLRGQRASHSEPGHDVAGGAIRPGAARSSPVRSSRLSKAWRASRAQAARTLPSPPNGTLAYVPAAQAYALVLVEPDGSERLLSEAPLIQNPQFSPNGQRLVVATTRRAGEQPDLWMHDLRSAAPPSRLTSDGGRAPVWTPDGASITYSHPVPSERSGIYTRSADGRGRSTADRSARRISIGWSVGRRKAHSPTARWRTPRQTASPGHRFWRSRPATRAVSSDRERRGVDACPRMVAGSPTT